MEQKQTKLQKVEWEYGPEVADFRKCQYAYSSLRRRLTSPIKALYLVCSHERDNFVWAVMAAEVFKEHIWFREAEEKEEKGKKAIFFSKKPPTLRNNEEECDRYQCS